jgi:hydroxymethylbilane synthase
MNYIKIGTRGSALARWQADFVQNKLTQFYPDIEIKQIIIKTEGDRDQNSSLSKIGGLGVFTKAIEDALLKNRIDIAVHSLKDLPSKMNQALELAAVPVRGPVEDALVSEKSMSLDKLPENAVIATGSIRRRSQLLSIRPDLTILDLRGNIDTRLRKIKSDSLDGIIMAKAALVRLKKSDVKYTVFPPDQMVPGVSQGAIGIQTRKKDVNLSKLLSKLNDESSWLAAIAERAFLHTLDSGCQFPVGAYARVSEDSIIMDGFVGSMDGKKIIKERITGDSNKAAALGQNLAKTFLKRGAGNLIATIKS